MEPTVRIEWHTQAARIARRFPVVAAKDDWVLLRWEGASPTILVKRMHVARRDRVLVAVDLQPAARVSAAEALELNGRLLIGTLIVWRGVLTLRHHLTAGQFTDDDLDETIVALRRTATKIGTHLERATEPDHAFIGYAD